MRLWTTFLAALTLLTRLPVSGWAPRQEWPEPAEAVWAYPLAGLIVGGAGAAMLWLAQHAGLTHSVSATLAVVVMVLMTGGLHEDGLADTADGFGGGAASERKLEIMRDSRIGSYGGLALVLTTVLRITALAALPKGQGEMALLAAGALSRGAVISLLLLLHPARTDGTAASLVRLGRGNAVCGLALAAAGGFCLPWPHAALCTGAVLVAALLLARIAKRQIGGHTGDVLGCTVITCECVTLVIAGLPV